MKKAFTKDIILLDDVAAVVDNIIEKMRSDLKSFRRYGGVVGVSGGIDSSVCLALASKAFGPEKIRAIMMPEQDSSPDSEMLARELCGTFGVTDLHLENLTPTLAGFQCYERRDEAVKRAFPEYDPATYKMKIGVKQSGLFNNLPPMFKLIIIDPDGNEHEKNLNAKDYMQIVASSNFKQRSRMSMLYYHAEALHYIVVGTPNKHETEQGFFVKYGDGGADIMPIGNLYKTQVYQIAEYMGVPKGIIERTPTTDTYSAEQTQEEFFYQLPFDLMDRYWYGFENGYAPSEVAAVMGETEERVKALFLNFERKRNTTEYLRMAPVREYYQS